ncbi:MAG: 3-hydroxyacyl-CoA dehydrogenase family protein, partial [Bacteroidales bacterium]|nr:3-hydroxyacyl-CoA dehydrogenase family protein [Bacteroidales bacterium]
IGCGNMGQEIVRIISQHGMDVIYLDLTEEKLIEIRKSIEEKLDNIINKWGLTGSEKRAIMSRIEGTTDYNDIRDCDLVIESINTRQRGTSLDARKEVFRKVEEVMDEETVIASNNATLMISDLATALQYPERAVGLNFITPSSKVRIVEVIRGKDTNRVSFEFLIRFIKMLDKRPITLNESLGNVSTRLIVTLINEACEVLMEGVASVKCIDETMKLGYGLQLGPFELADRVGLDKVQKWMDNLYFEFGMQKYKPAPILRRMVRSNFLGRKVGKGFYLYEEGRIKKHLITSTEFH